MAANREEKCLTLHLIILRQPQAYCSLSYSLLLAQSLSPRSTVLSSPGSCLAACCCNLPLRNFHNAAELDLAAAVILLIGFTCKKGCNCHWATARLITAIVATTNTNIVAFVTNFTIIASTIAIATFGLDASAPN